MIPHMLTFFILLALVVSGCVGATTQERLEMDCVNSVAHDYLYSTNFTEENKEYAMHYAVAECYRKMRT
jgi:hypothetical protein